MKKLILIIILSFLALSCTKEDNKTENQTRIKNDIPDELLGKWKIISKENAYWDGDGSIKSICPLNTGKKYDLWVKEYSICCIEQEAVCDQWWYTRGIVTDEGEGAFDAGKCGKEAIFSYFYIFDPKNKDVVLIGEGAGEAYDGYRYVKVE